MNNYYVYILHNYKNNVLYVGVTSDLEKRIFEHKNKCYEGFTQKYNVNKLVYYEQTTDIHSALNREKQIKSWTRVKKERLINKLNPERKDLSEEWNK